MEFNVSFKCINLVTIFCVFSIIELTEPSDNNQSFNKIETSTRIHLLISATSPTALTHSLAFFRLQLQVSRRSHEHVWRKPAQHSLQTVPSAPCQPGDHGATCGRTSHLIHRRHQRHADHAALDGELGTLSVRPRVGRCCVQFTRFTQPFS